MAVISGWFIEKFSGKIYMYIIGMVLGTAVTYIFGTVWLAQLLGRTFTEGLGIGVLPYLPGDAVKIIISVLVGPVLQKQLKRAGVL